MKNIVIAGSSGHAKVVIDIVRQEGRFAIAGLLDQDRGVGERILGCPVLGKDEDLPDLITRHALQGAIVAIGDNFIRAKVVAKIGQIAPDLPFVTAVHPGARIAMDVTPGEGTVVMSGGAINPGSSIGRFCLLNTNSSLDHDSVMEDFSSLAPGVITGGNCHLGEYAAINLGAVLVNGIQVGAHSVVGAGALVLNSIEPFVMAYGAPAKVIRTRKPGDQYW